MTINPQRAQALFLAALELTEPAARREMLDRECASDAALRQRVEALLGAHDAAGGFGDKPSRPGFNATIDEPAVARPGSLLAGRYKLIEAIGEGGMGTVWVAEQREPVRRKVAIKLIKAGMDSRSVLARFEAERQALAMMDHPNIAKVFDGGMTEQGRPYFVMEYVKGVPLTDYCDQARLSLKERLNLFMPVCQAVQHAHQKGIIHRDLKPSNILICLYDGKPVPKVIDFGLAKAMHQSLTDQSLHTAHGVMVGTPLYMSPEQAEHNNLDVDTRTDIYSLGVILYELLTGSTPLERQQLKDAAFNEILRLIKEVEPQKPSTRLSGSASLPSVAAQRSIDPRHLQRSLVGELDWIVMKTLEKERSRRYETANGLARDIERFLNDEAVEACPPSTAYRLKKFLRKHKGKAIAAGAVLMALVLGIIGTGWGLLRAEAAKAAANRSAQQAIASEEKTRTALEQETAARKHAQAAEARTLASYRDSTDDAIKELIGSKDELGYKERTYLQKTLKRWQAFADEQADDALGRNYRAEGHLRVANIWWHLGETTAARTSYEQARDIWQKLVEQFPSVPEYQNSLSTCHSNLGFLLTNLGETAAARTALEQGRDTAKKLVEEFPAVPDYQKVLATTYLNLGRVELDLGETSTARIASERACDILNKLAEQFPTVPEYKRLLASAHFSLASSFKKLGETTAARTTSEQACDILKKLVEQFPTVPEYQNLLAASHTNLGVFLQDLGETTAARTSYEQACDTLQRLVEQFPAVPDYQFKLALNHYQLGNLLNYLGETSAARNALERASNVSQKLVEKFPAVPEYQSIMATSRDGLGVLLLGLGKFKEARAEFEASLSIKKQLVDQFPNVPDYRNSLGGGYNNYGELLKDAGQLEESLTWFDKAIQTLEALCEKDQRAVKPKMFLAGSLEGRSQSYHRLKRYDEALKDLDRAIELNSPQLMVLLHSDRARSKAQTDKAAEALAEAIEVTKADSKDSTVLFNLACTFAITSGKIADKQQEYADRAMELLKSAIAAGYNKADSIAKDPDLDPLRVREDYKKLIAELEREAESK